MYLAEPAKEQQQCRHTAKIPEDQHPLKGPTSLPRWPNLKKVADDQAVESHRRVAL